MGDQLKPDNGPPSNDKCNNPYLVGNWIRDQAVLFPNKVAIEFLGASITYQELDNASSALAFTMLKRGLVRGDRVATLSENRPEHVALFFACAKLGLVLAPLNWHLTTGELQMQFELFTPSLLVISDAQRDRFSGTQLVPDLANLRMESLLPCIPVASFNQDSSVGSDDPLLLIATSGTTGTPKGAVLSHANCYWTNRSLDHSATLNADDVVLQVLPQYHVGGWNVQPLLAWGKGATVILEPHFDPRRVLELISTKHVTAMMGVPTNFQMLAHHKDFADADLSSLRSVLVGGAMMPPRLSDVWLNRGVAITHGYGLTEASPNVFYLSSDEVTSHPGSVGRPYNYVDVALYENGAVVEGIGRGELWVHGPNVFLGYWNDRAATDQVLKDGWLRTGDVAERDGDDCYRICGRIKEMYISGGENVFPIEVENVLGAYPLAAEAAVVAVEHPLWGEVGVAFVKARSETLIDVDSLLHHCRERLASYKVPSAIIVIDEIPRTHIGKIDKTALAALAVKNLNVPSM